MRFANPTILFALSAVSIPILIHLFNLRKFKRVLFTNVQLLKEVQQQTIKQHRLKHLLVLLSRILFILFLVFAFAKPFIPSSKQSIRQGVNYTSIYIDNSFSMNLQNEDGVLLEQAKNKAKEIISAYQASDKFQIISNDLAAQSQQFLTKEETFKAIDELKISPNFCALTSVMNRQNSLFATVSAINKNCFYLSDFQKNTIDKQLKQVIDTSINYRMVYFNASPIQNISIDSVWFDAPIHLANQAEKLIIKVSNHSAEAIKDLPINLQLNNQSKALITIDIASNATKIDTIFYTNNSSRIQKGMVAIASEQLPFDDQYYFGYEIAENIPVLLINGNTLSSKYIQSVYQTEAIIKLSVNAFEQINYADFNNYETIILNEPTYLSDGLMAMLQQVVADGKSLIIIPSEKTNLPALNKLLNTFQIPNFIALQANEKKIKELNISDKIFAGVFNNFSENMQFPTIKKYFSQQNTALEAILKLNDGTVVLQKNKYKKGSVYLYSFSLDPSFGDFAKHPLMVPLFLRIPQISNYDLQLAYEIGKQNRLNISTISNPISEQNQYLLTIGSQQWIPEWKIINSNTYLLIPAEINQAGWLTLQNKQQNIRAIALNYNRSESNLNYLNSSALSDFGFKTAIIYEASFHNFKNTIAQDNFGLQLWKICVILALVFLASEVLILRFFSRF
jgi:hypothetical protein